MEHIGEVLKRTQIGSESSQTSSRERKCEFCGRELEPLTWAKIGGVERPFGTKRCTCPEAVAHWAKIDEERDKMWREIEESNRRARLRELFRNSMIPERWKMRTFQAFQVNDENRKAYETARNFADSFDERKGNGLLFTGTVGTGKTHLAAAIAMELLNREKSVVFGTVTTLLSQIRRTYEGYKENEWDVIRRFSWCDLLIIDDIGKEKVSDWVQQTVYEIINNRYENNKSLIITTNMSLSDIRERYQEHGDAIVSRILEMCQGVRMDGPDWRKKEVLIREGRGS